MTFKGAFLSFQTVLVLCADTPGRSWVRARPASPAAPALPPQCCGVQHLAAQVLPTTVDPLPVVIGSISSQPSPGKLWIFLFCWAAPSRGRSCGHGQAAWGLVLAGTVCSESSICSSGIFPLGGESRQRRARGSGGRRVPGCRAAGNTQAQLRGTPALSAPPSPFRAPFGTGDLWDPRDAPASLPAPADCWERRLPALGAVLRLLKVLPLLLSLPSPFLPSSAGSWSTPEPWGHLHCPARGRCPRGGAAPGAAVPEDSVLCPGADAELALLGHLPCDPFAFGAGIRPLTQRILCGFCPG